MEPPIDHELVKKFNWQLLRLPDNFPAEQKAVTPVYIFPMDGYNVHIWSQVYTGTDVINTEMFICSVDDCGCFSVSRDFLLKSDLQEVREFIDKECQQRKGTLYN